MEQERTDLKRAEATVKAQNLRIEKLEHRLARLLRVQFGRSSEKMDIAQLRLLFDEVATPEPANDEAPPAPAAPSARKPGTRVPLPAHLPRQTIEHRPGACSAGCSGPLVQDRRGRHRGARLHPGTLPGDPPCEAARGVPDMRADPPGSCRRSAAAQGHGEQRAAGAPCRQPLRGPSALAPPVGDPAPRGSPHRPGCDEPVGPETGLAAGAARRAAVRPYPRSPQGAWRRHARHLARERRWQPDRTLLGLSAR